MNYRAQSSELREKKRILIFSLFYFPRFVGGAEIAVKEITDRLGADKYHFDLVTLKHEKQLSDFERIGNINVYRVSIGLDIHEINDPPMTLGPIKMMAPFLLFKKAKKLHKIHQYEIIWSIMAGYAGLAGLFFKKKFRDIKFLLTLQEGIPLEEIKRKARPIWFWFRQIFEQADYIQTISNFLADFAREMGYKGTIEVVPNGVEIKNAQRSTLNAQHKSFIILSTSRLVEKNGLEYLIRSLEWLPENFKIQIAGSGILENKLKQTASIFGDRVEFLGFIEPDKLPELYKNADVFCRPSLSEGLGNSFIEAMAAGLPVIATPVGGIPDFLEDRKTGLFVDVKDPKDIARKVDMYAKDGELRDFILENAYRMVSERFSWEIISQKIDGILSKI